ncbi:UPF0136 domain protein [Penicillium odoratum]|uniref:UPF0136 domain protein n=1 Tax=Penicillium odoratum TaxID=1167516 RepID=UPI0025482EB2|nr:UPF0136 domain protein [Penicillium odoratum]KAJ5765496.1 UPF0136 domain protein [Penicillium odoratum]
MADESPIQVHTTIGSLFAVTATIEYARTGRPNPLGPNYSTNTALGLSFLAFVAGIWNFARKGSAASVATGLAFCALYLISFICLQTDQWYGNEIALLASIFMGVSFQPWVIKVVGRPLPRESCLLGIYGTATFANAIHFWLGLALSLSFAILAASNDAVRYFKLQRNDTAT